MFQFSASYMIAPIAYDFQTGASCFVSSAPGVKIDPQAIAVKATVVQRWFKEAYTVKS